VKGVAGVRGMSPIPKPEITLTDILSYHDVSTN
jgi:hypothetical protein